MTRLIDPQFIDQVVVEVLAQLRQRVDAARSSSPIQQSSSPISTQIKEPKSQPTDTIELLDAVITEETLKQHAQPGETIHVTPRAILTPTARDYIRSHQLSIRRQNQNEAVNSSRHSNRGTIIAAHLPEVVRSFLENVSRQAKTLWAVEMESGTQQVVDRIRSVICRGESQQVLVFVKNPHHVACLVNRNLQCRAAVVRSGPGVRTVRAEFAANVICVDLQQPTFMGLREILRTSTETNDQVHEPKGS